MVDKTRKYEIVYASDDAFAPILGVSIESLLENNLNAEINITILCTSISKINKDKIKKICHKYESNVRFINIVNIEEKFNLNLNKDRGSISQYARLMISEAFSSETKRVLYLDSDTLIVDDLSELWDLDLGNNIVGVLKDAFSEYYRQNINLKNDNLMFNSGVMLIDLEKWREYKIEDKLINVILEKKGQIQQGDQGVLNEVLSHYAMPFAPKFNMVSIFYDLTYKQIENYRRPVNFYTESEINESKKNPVILHYTSSFYTLRPWQMKTISKDDYRYKWEIIRKKTLWSKDDIYNKVSSLKKILCKLPLSLLIKIAAPLQIYIRPLRERIRK